MPGDPAYHLAAAENLWKQGDHGGAWLAIEELPPRTHGTIGDPPTPYRARHRRRSCQCGGMKRKLYALVALAMIFASGCGLLDPKPPEVTRTIDHSPLQPIFENAELWNKVQDDPATFHPRPLPSGSTISAETGDWVIDPQDQAAFFVPSKKCGDLTSAMWRAEALKGINFTKGKQTGKNAAKILFGWPAYLSLVALNEGTRYR